MKFPKSAAIAILLAPLLLAGCNTETPESMLASAKSYLAKNDSKAAIIQIKNALQANPDLAEARYLLGISLLDSGNANSAELELRKALALKYSPDLVIPKLASSLLAQRQSRKVIDEFGQTQLSVPSAAAELQLFLGSAYSINGKPESAEISLKKALSADPDYVPALLAQARSKAARRDFDGAMSVVETIIAKSPKSADAWKLKGDIFLADKDDSEKALAAYRKSIEIDEKFLPSYLSAVSLLVRKGDIKNAEKQFVPLKKLAPDDFQTQYLETQISYLKKDAKTARVLVQKLIKRAPENASVLQMAGAIELQDNSFLPAESYLVRSLQFAPNVAFTRKILVLTYLRSGQPGKALSTLTGRLEKEGIPPDQYSIAGEVYMQNGDVKKAEEYFTRAAKQDPGDPRKRTAVALTRLVSGQVVPAFDELKEIAASDKGVSADLTLISAYLNRGEFDKALVAISGLEKKQPGDPLAATLRGRTQLALKDSAGARLSFERALVITPDYFSAVSSLVSLDMAEKNPDDARKRMEALVAKDPKNIQALLVLAGLATVSGAGQEEVAKFIRKAIAVGPTEIAPRLQLISHYMRSKDLKQAALAAQDAAAALPESPDILDALGQVQQGSGELNQAIGTYTKLAELQSGSPQPLVRLAAVHILNKNIDAAERSLRKAIELKPDFLDAQRALLQLYFVAQKFPEALAIAHKVQEQRPKDPVGYVFEGDVDLAQKNWELATKAYRAGLKQAPSSELAIKLYAVLISNNKTSESEVFSRQWQKENPGDASFIFYLGDLLLVQKKYSEAEEKYLAVTRIQPSNAAAFNNLAWVASRNKSNSETAMKYSEIANKLAPNQPAFMDTMASILSDKKEFEKAIDIQKNVVKLQPDNSFFRLSLAKIYVQAGDKSNAKQELNRLAEMGEKFSAQAEVSSLLKSL